MPHAVFRANKGSLGIVRFLAQTNHLYLSKQKHLQIHTCCLDTNPPACIKPAGRRLPAVPLEPPTTGRHALYSGFIGYTLGQVVSSPFKGFVAYSAGSMASTLLTQPTRGCVDENGRTKPSLCTCWLHYPTNLVQPTCRARSLDSHPPRAISATPGQMLGKCAHGEKL